MAGKLIILCLLVVLAILLLSPMQIRIAYLEGRLHVECRYLFLRLTEQTLARQREKQVKKQNAKKKEPKPDKPKKKKESALSSLKPKSFDEGLGMLQDIFSSLHMPTRLICRGIAIRDIYIDFTVSDTDAAVCAIRFGRVNIAVYNLLAVLAQFFRLSKKQICVRCCYHQPKGVYDCSCRLTLTPAIAMAAGIGFIFRFLVNTRKRKKQARTAKPAQAAA